MDYGEYYTALNRDDSSIIDVDNNKSLWFNLRPQITIDTDITVTIFATFGTSIAYSLDGLEPTDFEDDEYIRFVSESQNYKLLMWANGYGRDSYLYSEILEQGINCDIG